MHIQDAVYNWLMVKVVCDQIPEDEAAQTTLSLFESILQEEHGAKEKSYDIIKDMYVVTFIKEGKKQTLRFPVPMVESLLTTIQQSTKTT